NRYHEAAPLVVEAGHSYRHAYWGYNQYFRKLQYCHRLAESDPGLPSDEREALARQYEDWTIDLICELFAREKEPTNAVGTVKAAKSLDFIRSRPEFQALVGDPPRRPAD